MRISRSFDADEPDEDSSTQSGRVMDLENLNAPRPALPPQTRACLNCAHAKTKCIMTSGVGGKCERYIYMPVLCFCTRF